MSRVRLLGVDIDRISKEELMTALDGLVKTGNATISYANAHVLNLATKNHSLSQFLAAADLVYCDGNGVRLASMILGQPIPERMTGADWIWDLAAKSEGKWRLYWIGGEPGVTAAAAARLHEHFPRLEIQTDHGFHARTGPADAASIRRINSFEPHILLVGMGTPDQEDWVGQNRDKVSAPVVWCLGATADVVSGKEQRGPDWLTRHAEWISRLAQDPRRLWRRYLVGNPLFVARVLRQRVGLARP